MRKTFVLSACIAVLALALLACGESTNTGTAVTSTGNTPAPTVAPAKHFTVGQTVKVGDTWQIVVNSAKESAGSAYFKPKSGNAYLIVTVSAKNLSASEQVISSLVQFHLQDTNGQEYQIAIDPDAGATLDGKVEAGSPRKGVLTYEVPKGTKSFTLGFENSIVDQGQTIWDIHI